MPDERTKPVKGLHVFNASLWTDRLIPPYWLGLQENSLFEIAGGMCLQPIVQYSYRRWETEAFPRCRQNYWEVLCIIMVSGVQLMYIQLLTKFLVAVGENAALVPWLKFHQGLC